MKKISKVAAIGIVAIITVITVLFAGCSNESSSSSSDSEAQEIETNQVETSQNETNQDETVTEESQEEDSSDLIQEENSDQTTVEDFTIDLNTIIADVIDISQDDLTAELSTGKTIAEIAGEMGIETQTLIDLYLAEFSNKLSTAVENGEITQEEADTMLENEQNTIEDKINSDMSMMQEENSDSSE